MTEAEKNLIELALKSGQYLALKDGTRELADAALAVALERTPDDVIQGARRAYGDYVRAMRAWDSLEHRLAANNVRLGAETLKGWYDEAAGQAMLEEASK